MVYFTKITIPEDKNITGLLIRGHAHYARKNKDDIVCSGISAIAQMAAYGCKFYDKHCKIEKLQEGHVAFTCNNTVETSAIINSALIGLKALKRTYPKCFSKFMGDINE